MCGNIFQGRKAKSKEEEWSKDDILIESNGFKFVTFYNKGFSIFLGEVQILLWQNLLFHMERGQQYNGKWKEKGKYYTLYILEKLSENTYTNFCMKKDWKDLLYLLNNRTLVNSNWAIRAFFILLHILCITWI